MTTPQSPDQAPQALRDDLRILAPTIAVIALKYGIGTEGTNLCNGFGSPSTDGYEVEAERAWRERPGADAATDTGFDDDITAIEVAIERGAPCLT